MEMNDTSPGPENQQGTNYKSEPKNEENALQQHTADQWRPNVEKKSFGAMAKDVRRFFWNPETRECMGRTSQSWGQILLFYLIFYSFLAGMFTLCLYVLLLTVSPYTPTYRDRVSPPGAMIRPSVKDSKLSFNISDQNSWESYVNSLDQFLQAYNDAVQEANNIPCTPGQYFIQETIESAPKQACQFKRSLLGNCSGLEDPSYGYSLGEPCILLKMNRIIGYKPGYGSPVTVSCKLYKDDDYFPEVKFYPHAMFDLMYYPYYGKFTHVNYTSPLVAIQFKNVKMNHPLTIQCQLNGVGIINNFNPDKFLGRIVVRLTVGP
ncbi:protein ATP1B4 [Tiliqua scincoides]|uniref:protein ATP1B4 n=1 Tax=Tiliqua scincoides TaxID=71010 RepID=UPI0034625A97